MNGAEWNESHVPSSSRPAVGIGHLGEMVMKDPEGQMEKSSIRFWKQVVFCGGSQAATWSCRPQQCSPVCPEQQNQTAPQVLLAPGEVASVTGDFANQT